MSEHKLGDIAEILIGGTPSRNNPSYWQQNAGGYNWVAISDLKGSRIISDTKERITERGTQNSNVKLIPQGSLIMSFKLSVGRCAITGKDLYTNEAIAAFLPNEDRFFEPEFLYYALPAIDFTLLTDVAVKGATLNKQKLKNIRLEVPPLPTQRKIARILSTIDGQIEKTEAIIAKYQAVKQGMLQDLFTRGIDIRTGQLRPRYEDAPELYQESALGMIPKEWAVVGLKDIGETETPYLKTGPFGSSLKISDWVDEGVPVITIGSLGENEFTESELLMITQAKAEELRGYRLNVGDIVFSRVADVGRSLVIKDSQKGWVMSSNFMRMRLNPRLYSPDFLQLVIKYSDELQRQQSQFVNANGRTVVNSSTLNSFLFPKPNLSEQGEILMKIQGLDAVYSNDKKTLAKLRLLKQGMMQDLLSGKVEVTA